MMVIVIAQNWEAFNWYCDQKELDPRDRKVVIPLIDIHDRYRLYGRNLGSRPHQVVKVGTIDEQLLNSLYTTLEEEGIQCK